MSGELVLGAKCAGCGHDTGKHPSAEHATAYIANSNGRYAPECLGREGNAVSALGPIACRCRATREEVSASADLRHTQAAS